MSQPVQPPNLNITQSSDYRDGYANSVQVRASVWDFLLVFGTARQDQPDEVVLRNFQGVYLSPQQAKALWNLLGQNLAQYEQAFGSINLEPTQSFPGAMPGSNGPVQ
jgi:flagellar protein FlaG